MKEVLIGLGGLLIWGAFAVIAVMVVTVFYYGAAWAGVHLLPWLSILSWVTFGFVVFIVLPLAIPKVTRGFSSIALYIASYVFGVTLWMEGLLLTLGIWGFTAVIIGIVMGGVGVVPIAMLATLIERMWFPLVELVLLTILTFGGRAGALSLAYSLER